MKKIPPKILTVEEVVAKDVFDKEFSGLKKELEYQKSITWQIVIGVAIAFVLAVGVIVVDTILISHSQIQRYDAIIEEISDKTIQMNDLKNQIDNLHIRNPYLK